MANFIPAAWPSQAASRDRGVRSAQTPQCISHIGIMEKKMETTIMGYIGVI